MKSKNLHRVYVKVPLTQPNDASQYAASGEIDTAVLMSKKYGRQIKQGKSFRLVGASAFLVGDPGASDPSGMDTGMAAAVRLQYYPTTYHSANAWRKMARQYSKQKSYRRGLLGNTKGDDFEVAIHQNGIDSRTSRVYTGGINDPTPEYVVISGGYDDEDGILGAGGDPYIALNHYYDVVNPVETTPPLQEEDLLFDDSINQKPLKYGSKFPAAEQLGLTATLSSHLFYDHDILIDDIYDSGAMANSTNMFLPADNHLNVLCGRFAYRCHVLARDDENIWADQLFLYIVLDFEGWSSLWPRKKKSKGGKSRGSSSKRRWFRRRG